MDKPGCSVEYRLSTELGNCFNNSGIPLVYLGYFLIFMMCFKRNHLKFPNWASEASPTLGCSIEISRDIYIYVGMYVCRMSN